MSEKQGLDWLAEWYAAHCNDEWEHNYGIAIDTIDNPGWHIKIDLVGTVLEAVPFQETKHNYDNDTSWWICSRNESAFEAYCGPQELGEAVNIFRMWAEKNDYSVGR